MFFKYGLISLILISTFTFPINGFAQLYDNSIFKFYSTINATGYCSVQNDSFSCTGKAEAIKRKMRANYDLEVKNIFEGADNGLDGGEGIVAVTTSNNIYIHKTSHPTGVFVISHLGELSGTVHSVLMHQGMDALFVAYKNGLLKFSLTKKEGRFGYHEFKQIYSGEINNLILIDSSKRACFLSRDQMHCYGSGRPMGPKIFSTNSLEAPLFIYNQESNICVYENSGTNKCWGSTYDIGLPEKMTEISRPLPQLKPIDWVKELSFSMYADGSEYIFIKEDGKLRSFDKLTFKKIDIPPLYNPSFVQKVSLRVSKFNSGRTLCALDEEGLKCWDSYSTKNKRTVVVFPNVLISDFKEKQSCRLKNLKICYNYIYYQDYQLKLSPDFREKFNLSHWHKFIHFHKDNMPFLRSEFIERTLELYKEHLNSPKKDLNLSISRYLLLELTESVVTSLSSPLFTKSIIPSFKKSKNRTLSALGFTNILDVPDSKHRREIVLSVLALALEELQLVPSFDAELVQALLIETNKVRINTDRENTLNLVDKVESFLDKKFLHSEEVNFLFDVITQCLIWLKTIF